LLPLALGLGATLVKVVSGAALAAYEARLAGFIVHELRNRLARTVLRRGAWDSGDALLARFATRLRELELAVIHGPVAAVRAVFQLVPLALALIFLSLPLAIGAAVVGGAFGLLLASARRGIRSAAAESQALAERTHTEVHELLRNVDLWRTYGRTDRMTRAIDEAGQRATVAAARSESLRAVLAGSNEVLGAVAVLGAAYVALKLGVAFEEGTWLAVLTVLFMAYRPLRDLGDARVWVVRGQSAWAALEPERDAVAPLTAEVPTDSAPRLPFVPASLRILEYGAASRGPRVSFELPAVGSIALVGPTGAGKTTLLRALLGLEPASGQLLYGDLDLTGAGVGPSERPFVWVPQDAPLITASIRDNVAWLGGDAERAQEALLEVGAGALVARLGSTKVGPGGQPLSGGERRLVAMARALATTSPVLLLDEPTEGLDPASSAHVIELLSRLAERRALIVVTHRAEVARALNRVLTLTPRATEPQAPQP
jgi:ABC-type multidrug transport system fused ATPase/permease subunit